MITFRALRSLEEAEELKVALERHGFMAQLVHAPQPLGSEFTGASADYYHIMLDGSEFSRAEKALEADPGQIDPSLIADHYLSSFSDQELIGVVTKMDEWSAFDRHLAREILTQRGKPVSDELLTAFRQQRMEDLRQEASPQTAFIVLGYVSSLLGGLLGVAIGYHLNMARKTLPDGERVYVHRAADRRHGKRMFFLGIVIFSLFIIIRLAIWLA